MKRRLLLGVAATALVVTGGTPGLATTGPAPAHGATSTTALGGVARTLAHTVPALVRVATDLGPLDATRRLRVTLSLALPDQAALDRFVAAQYEPHSATFHRFLRPATFGQMFGASAAAVAVTTQALRQLGLRVDSPAANHLDVTATAPVSLLEKTFATPIHRFQLGAQSFYANTRDVRLPAVLARTVTGVIGLDDESAPRPLLSRAARAAVPQLGPVGQNGGATPCPGAVAGGGYTAPQLATAYDFNGLYAKGLLGQGMSAALVEFDDYHDSNVASMESCYGLHTPVTRRVVAGGTGGPPAGGEVEDMADITTLLEMLPQLAHLYVYVAPVTSVGELQLYDQFVTDDLAPVMSSSWGNCEELNSAADNRLYADITEEAAAQGQQILDASGDSGAVDCSSLFPSPTGDSISAEQEAAVPWVTGVGGTDLGERTANGVDAGTRDEATWNDGGAGGGGVSSLWRMPSWQYALASARTAPGHTGAPCGAPKGQLCREVPDISADADPLLGMQGNSFQFTDDVGSPGYSFYCATPNCSLPGIVGAPTPPGAGWQPVGGTSLSTPLTAAAVVLWDQAAKAAGLNGLGLINPAMYRIAADPAKYAHDFHDITTGSNDAQYDTADCPKGCNPHHLYAAAVGYDMATGLGSYDAANLGADMVAAAEQVTTLPDHATVYGYLHGVATTAPVVVSSGYRAAAYTVTSNARWLHAKRGTAPGGLSWSVSPAGLAPGTYHGRISLDANGHRTALTVTYSVSRRARLSLSTHNLHFLEGALNSSGKPTIPTCKNPKWDDEMFDALNGSSGTPVSPSSRQTLRITNTGPRGSRLHWQAFPASDTGSWLSVELAKGKVRTAPGPAIVPTDGVDGAGQTSALPLISIANVNALGGYPAMEQGTYYGTVKVYDLADPRVVRVVHATLVLGTGQQTPTIHSFEKSTHLQVKQGGSTSFTIQLSDSSAGCGYAYSLSSNRDWVTPNADDYSGTVPPKGSGKTGGSDTGSGTGTIDVTVSAANLSAGTHRFTITIQSQNAEPNPDRIAFTVAVTK